MIPLADAHARYVNSGGDAPLSRWQTRARVRSSFELGPGRQFVRGAPTSIRAHKVGGRWLVDEHEFAAALEEAVLARKELEQISQKYSDKLLVGEAGRRVNTTWGYYVAGTVFHERIDYRAAYLGGRGSLHRCNGCWEIATYERDRPECHLCRDWGSCGRDCTRSAIICATCGARVVLSAERGGDPRLS